ncbi:PspC domain-containing protein [Dietzia aerolata]|uniref:PspC domain-containing protein n=1 Tax=Dietzia aerolata TaxID=595984 RepID=UPI0036348AB2
MSENATGPARGTGVPAARPAAAGGPVREQVREPVWRPPGPASVPTTFRWYPRLTRSADRSVVGGVCAGIADHLDVKITYVRLAMVLLATLSGAGVALYSVLWVMLPSAPARADEARADGDRANALQADLRERRTGKALVALALVGSVLSFMLTTTTGLNVIVPVLVVALGAGLVWQQYDRGERSLHGPPSTGPV